MKAQTGPSTRLVPLILLIGTHVLVPSGTAWADQGTVLVASTSAEQFALLGGVFLLLGGAFVFAPQIVSGVNGFIARLFGRPRKVKTTPEPAPTTAHPHPIAPPGAEAEALPPADTQAEDHSEDHSEWAPPPEPPPGQAVSRLRDEIGSAWGRREES